MDALALTALTTGNFIIAGYSHLMFGASLIFGLIDDEKPNAFVSAVDDETFEIQISVGLLEEVRRRCYLFAEARSPEDVDAYALHLIRLSVAFLVEHELSHVFNGHLGYLQAASSRGVLELHELGLGSSTGLRHEVRKALEFDADCTALTRHGLWAHNVSISGAATSAVDRFSSTALIWYDVLVTLHLLFRIFFVVSPGTLTHPHPAARLIYVQETLVSVCRQYEISSLGSLDSVDVNSAAGGLAVLAGKNSVPLVEVEIGYLAGLAERRVVAVLEQNNEGMPLVDRDQALAVEDVSALKSCWAAIRDDIAPHALVRLVASDGSDPTPERATVLRRE